MALEVLGDGCYVGIGDINKKIKHLAISKINLTNFAKVRQEAEGLSFFPSYGNQE